MAIELSELCFSYPEQANRPVLNIPSWSLAKGEQAFIFGPSGTGKSTLLSILSGVLPLQSGEVNVFQHDLRQLSARERDKFRANHIGYVFQEFNLIPYLDAIENVRLANYFSNNKSGRGLDQEIEALLTRLNLSPQHWKKPVRHLSIGQQQRIAIARALINKPLLLIADEPTSSLDESNRDIFMKLLMSIVKSSGITLLFVSHDMTLARYFSRVESLTDINQVGQDLPC